MFIPSVGQFTSAALIAAALVISSTGCAVMRRGNLNSRPLDAEELAQLNPAAGEEAAQPTVTVSIKTQFGKRKTTKLPLEHGMTLQNVLEETKVTRRFRDMEINVMRVTPQSKGQLVPLQAEYDTVRNRVGVLHDMTLHPGDHIMIVEEVASPIEDAIGMLKGRRK